MKAVSKDDLEKLCSCGKSTCCKASVPTSSGHQVVVKGLKCKFLLEKSGKSGCSVYATRFKSAPWCMSLLKGFQNQAYPSDGSCGYVLEKSYKGKVELSDEEYAKVEPQLIKSFMDRGQPEWASDEDWLAFTSRAVSLGLEKSLGDAQIVSTKTPFDAQKT